MPESFDDRDLSGAEFWAVDLSGATFRDVNLTGVTITNAFVVNVDIDATIDNVTINGVDVTAYVNERDPWHPLRAMLRPPDAAGMRAAWAALEDVWTSTIVRARELPEEKLHAAVNGEWSFVETLQHLVFGVDKWFTVPILGERFHPLVLPNRGSNDLDWPGRDRDATPTLSEALEARHERAGRVRDYLETVTAPDLTTTVDVLENGTTPINECLYTVFEEAFWHNRYALRDLALLAQ